MVMFPYFMSLLINIFNLMHLFRHKDLISRDGLGWWVLKNKGKKDVIQQDFLFSRRSHFL